MLLCHSSSLYERAMEGTTCVLPLLVFIVTLHTLPVLGDVIVSTTPPNPVRSEKVSIECVVSVPAEVKPDTCRIWWTRTVYPRGRHHSSEGLAASANMHIYTMYDADTERYRSVIIIQRMTESVEGAYTCNLMCPQITESAHVDLSLFEETMHLPSIVGICIVGSSILTAALIGGCIKCCSSRRSRRNASSSSSSRSSLSTVSSEFLDAPPRYSLAVEANPEGGVHTVLRNPQGHHQRASIYSIAFVGTPPPDYAQALEDLHQKGIFFNTALLEPMPPAYSDVRKIANSHLHTQEV